MSAMRVFFVEAGAARRVSYAAFDRLHAGKERMAAYAGRRVKYAWFFLAVEGRTPVAVTYAEFGVLTFDPTGHLDAEAAKEAMTLAAESLPQLLGGPREGSVIHAESRFARKRYFDRFKWAPPPDELDAIQVALWASTGPK